MGNSTSNHPDNIYIYTISLWIFLPLTLVRYIKVTEKSKIWGPGKLSKLRNPKILLRKLWKMIFQLFFLTNQVLWQLQGFFLGLIFRVKKNATLGVTGKSRCFFWKSKEIENQSCQFFIFFSKTPIFWM